MHSPLIRSSIIHHQTITNHSNDSSSFIIIIIIIIIIFVQCDAPTTHPPNTHPPLVRSSLNHQTPIEHDKERGRQSGAE